MKILSWFWAVWRSFQVSQNINRLIFLRAQLDDLGNIPFERRVTVETWRTMANEFLFKHVLQSEIFTLDQANDLLKHSGILIGIGERLLYGSDKPIEAEIA